MSGPEEIVCGWCGERPATCFVTEQTRALARRQRQRLGYDFESRRDGSPHREPWPLAGCDECCGHCRCGWAMCACEFIHEPKRRDLMDIPEEFRAAFERINQMDSRNKEEARAVGERMGYGALMTYAQECWAEKLAASGGSGGEFAIGPCVAQLVPCESVQHRKKDCDWCCGSRRVTRRVAEAIAEAEKDLRPEADVEEILES